MINKIIQFIKTNITSKIYFGGDRTEGANNIKDKTGKFASEVWEKVAGYLLEAFGLVAGLAWNDAIRALIARYYTVESDSLLAQLAYAIIITILVVIVSIIFVKLSKRNEKEK